MNKNVKLEKWQVAQKRHRLSDKHVQMARELGLSKTYQFEAEIKKVSCSDSNGKVALYGMKTEKYQNFLADTKIRKLKAMKSIKKK